MVRIAPIRKRKALPRFLLPLQPDIFRPFVKTPKSIDIEATALPGFLGEHLPAARPVGVAQGRPILREDRAVGNPREGQREGVGRAAVRKIEALVV